MSDLSDLTASTRTDVIDGYALSPWGLREYGDAEAEFARDHLRSAAEAGIGLPVDVADRLVDRALKDVKNGDFNWGGKSFDKKLLSTALLPFRLWMCLRVKHPNLSREQAANLITEANAPQVNRATLELLGFNLDAKPDPNASGQSSENQSTGDSSSKSSDVLAA